MKRNTHNSTISVNQSTPEVSHKDAVTSTDSHPALDEKASASTVSIYWFPGRVLLPPHLLHLMQVHNRLRAERESHTVTYSREQPGALSMRNIVNTFKSYILSSEDEAGIRYAPKDLGYLANDREPMFVIVDSSCVSNPSSRELLIDNRYHTRDPILKRHQFNKNVMPVDVPSTSRDLRNDFMAAPLLMESESTDEMQMIDINLQSDNELLIGSDSDCDNDSIVMSYLKNKDAFLDLEGTLMSTKKKSSLLEHVPKMETIVESELFYSFPIIPQSNSSLDLLKNGDKTN